MKRTKIKLSRADVTFDVIKWVFLVLCLVLVIFPILNVISLAFSKGQYNSEITFFPVWKGLTLDNFSWLFKNDNFLSAIKNSLLLRSLRRSVPISSWRWRLIRSQRRTARSEAPS